MGNKTSPRKIWPDYKNISTRCVGFENVISSGSNYYYYEEYMIFEWKNTMILHTELSKHSNTKLEKGLEE